MRPVTETSYQRKWRPVVLKVRPLDSGGPAGFALSASSAVSFPELTIQTYHWGLQIGPYLWELIPDGNGNLSYRHDMTWESTVGQGDLGQTRITDSEIEDIGMWKPPSFHADSKEC